jgi:hypothetical protein
MNSYETQALRNFLDQLLQVRGVAKDADAVALIDGAVKLQPDAAYLLVQRSMLLDHALTEAKAQIAELQAAAEAAKPGGFLNQADAWGNSARSAAPPMQSARPAEYMPQPAQAAPAPVAAAPGFLGGGMGGMLGTMAATAAGVAGGAFLFRGIENMMHPHGAADPASQAAHAGNFNDPAPSSALAEKVPNDGS